MTCTRSRSSSTVSLKTQKPKKTTKIENPGKLLKAEELSDTLTVLKVKKTVSFFYVEAEVEVEKPKHRQVTSACGCCRRRKSKCDGQRPTCGACVARKLDCEYDAGEGETLEGNLKRQISELKEKLEMFEETLGVMKGCSERDWAAIGHFVKNMENVEEFCACITTAKMLYESAAGM